MPEQIETARLAADVVAITRPTSKGPSPRVLLIERGWDPYEGAWALPGGHLEPGEAAEAAAAREAHEETGVQVALADLVSLGAFHAPGRDPRGRYVSLAYLALVPPGTPAVADDDARAADWFPLDDLPPLAFDHAEIITAATAATAALSREGVA